jgi:hypothetical protein
VTKIRSWFKELRWLKRGDWAFLTFPFAAMLAVTILFVSLAVSGQWVAVFPLMGLAGITATTLNYIEETIRSNRWWDQWEEGWKVRLAEIRKGRDE